MSIIKTLGIVTLTAAVTAVVTYKVTKEKIEQKTFDDMKAMFEETAEKCAEDKICTENDGDIAKPVIEESTDETAATVEEATERNLAEEYVELQKKVNTYEAHDEPVYIIPDDEFDTLEDFEAETFAYFADGVLTHDCDDSKVENVSDYIPKKFLNLLGDAPDGVPYIYVRNDEKKLDMEIYYDRSTYKECYGEE